MNTHNETQQAVEDYRAARLGIISADHVAPWKSYDPIVKVD
jgi:hypothetical protein